MSSSRPILTEAVSSVKIEAMNAELTSDLKRRAAQHAALADPARLRIVDLLATGDRSPLELQMVLGMPSNLVAHHLRVLEERGMLTRTRSEGDRRRSYLRLRAGGFAGLASVPMTSARRVLFVCTANSARSQLAAALWQQKSAIPVASAGTHPADRVDPGAVKAARRHRLILDAPRPLSISDVYEDHDYVITVCDAAHEELSRADAVHWSVPDPVRVGTDSAFDDAYDELARRVDDLAPRLTAA